jgi:P pilus assembly chaperone PapD
MDVSPESRLSGDRFYWLVGYGLGCLPISAALAVIITPVKVELSSANAVVTITVSNDADLPLGLQ